MRVREPRDRTLGACVGTRKENGQQCTFWRVSWLPREAARKCREWQPERAAERAGHPVPLSAMHRQSRPARGSPAAARRPAGWRAAGRMSGCARLFRMAWQAGPESGPCPSATKPGRPPGLVRDWPGARKDRVCGQCPGELGCPDQRPEIGHAGRGSTPSLPVRAARCRHLHRHAPALKATGRHRPPPMRGRTWRSSPGTDGPAGMVQQGRQSGRACLPGAQSRERRRAEITVRSGWVARHEVLFSMSRIHFSSISR